MSHIRHKKRGTTYEVVGEAEAQISVDDEGRAFTQWGDNVGIDRKRRLLDGDKLVVYRCLETGKLWCRFPDEFSDGRFEEIP